VKKATIGLVRNLVKQQLQLNDVDIRSVVGRGDVNQIFIITSFDQKVVLRLNSLDQYDRFLKEAWCLKKAGQKGVVGPKPLSVGTVDDFSFMFVSFLPGVVGKDAGVVPDVDIWFQIGKYARSFHKIKTSGFGESFKPGSDGAFDDSWQRFLNYNISSLNEKDPLLNLAVFDSGESRLIKKLFLDFKTKRFKFGLTHGDLSLANVMVDGKSISLFDWGCAGSYIVPHFEIEEILRTVLPENSNEFKSFLAGYGLSWLEFKQIRSEILTLRLLWVVDKLRWAVDKNPNKIKFYSNEVKKSLSLII